MDRDADVDLKKYATFAWSPGTPASSELTQRSIEQAIEQQLAAKGVARAAEGATPDLLVVTHVSKEDRTELHVDDYGYAASRGRWVGAYPTRAYTTTYTVGTLIVDLVDAPTRALVWRGAASSTIGDDPAKLKKKIAKVVTKMFVEYPQR